MQKRSSKHVVDIKKEEMEGLVGEGEELGMLGVGKPAVEKETEKRVGLVLLNSDLGELQDCPS